MMKKIISIALIVAMTLGVVVFITAAEEKPPEIKIEGASVSAEVDKLNGNQNKLWITIVDTNGSITESFMIANNAAGTYIVGNYEVYVDTKGNTQIRECYFVAYIGGDNRNPTITVLTNFPSGNTTNNIVDINYIATPGTDAFISEVYYSINGGAEEYIYLLGDDIVSPKGELGTARVLLIPGENNIVFTVMDSAGRTGNYTVSNKPVYNFGTIPEYNDDDLHPLSTDPDCSFVKNWLIAHVKDGISSEQVQEAISSFDGSIIGKVNIIDMYYLFFPEDTEAGLLSISTRLLNTYPEIFEIVCLEIVADHILFANPTNDQWWNDGVQWGMDTINAPAAWSAYNRQFRNIKIGILDNGFRNGHDDLRIANDNVVNSSTIPNVNDSSSHGTHVLGIFAAIHNNTVGVCGAIDVPRRDSIFAYTPSSSSPTAIINGFIWTVIRGAKVINCSLGSTNNNTTERFRSAITKMLTNGYDFLISQAAGNDARDFSTYSESFAFASVVNQAVANRVIVVGAVDVGPLLPDGDYEMASFSNYGPLDAVAPGVLIHSTVASSDSDYAHRMASGAEWSGTSQAAPHVAGVAGLVWSLNPGLSGNQVKQIIVDSSTTVAETRTDASGSLLPGGPYNLVDAKAALDMAKGWRPEHSLGRLAGQVIDATSEAAISDAHINLHISPARQPVTSDVEGHYRIDNIPPGRYYLDIAKEGFIPESFYIQIEAGVTTHLQRLRAVPVSSENGRISGAVLHALTGTFVNDEITLEFRRGIDVPGTPVHTMTISNGMYNVNDLPPGNYTVTARGVGYITTTAYVVSIGGRLTSNQNVVISPELSEGTGKLRFVLTWGAQPRDLDSHLVGPTPDGNRFHIYYSNRSYTYYLANYFQELKANLDVDITSGYGPETVTIHSFSLGRYEYYVQDYTNLNSTVSNALRNSQAVVRIYSEENTLLQTINVPTSSGYSTIWHVFSIDVKYQNGEYVYTVIPVNMMHNVPTSPRNVGMGSASSFSMYSINQPVYLTDEEIEAKAAAEQEAGIFVESSTHPEDEAVYETDLFEPLPSDIKDIIPT